MGGGDEGGELIFFINFNFPYVNILIFKLNRTSSPFNKGLYMVESNSKFDKSFNWLGNKNACTTDYFQYAIVVCNSDWAVPYGDNKAK